MLGIYRSFYSGESGGWLYVLSLGQGELIFLQEYPLDGVSVNDQRRYGRLNDGKGGLRCFHC